MRAIVLVLQLMLAAGHPGSYTVAEAEACYGDSMRFCGTEMRLPPLLSYPAVRLCMLYHRHDVSPKCDAVFRAHGF